MKLTRPERLILLNQYRLIALLDESPDTKEECDRATAILQAGYEAHYDELAYHVSEETFSEQDADDVTDTLSMYEHLQRACEEQGTPPGVEDSDLTFRGFDGNNETEHRAYALFFCGPTGPHGGENFTTLRRASDMNSHTRMLPKYRRMLAVFRETRAKSYGDRLTPEQVAAIVRAGRPPE